MKTVKQGQLFVVATPIGHLEDISARALTVLKDVDLILAEDTRVTKKLLQRYQITTPTQSFYAQTEQGNAERFIEQIKAGEQLALVSDAGTPLISDPGYYLVRRAREEGVPVQPVPGACALIAALSVSGLPTDEFMFKGFLSTKKTLRKKAIAQLQGCTTTSVLYEAPHRIVGLIKQLAETLDSGRLVFLAREMTKMYETYELMTLKDAVTYVQAESTVTKGEWVVALAGSSEPATATLESFQPVLQVLLNELPLKQAVALTCKITQAAKNEVYELALKLQK